MHQYPYNHTPGNLPPTMTKIPFFKAIDDKSLDEVLGRSSLLDCEPGDVIIKEGTLDKDLFVLLKGQVQVEKDGKVVAGIGQQGELLGELALISEEGRSASVVAASRVYCLKIEGANLKDLSEADRNAYYAAVYQFLARLLAERLEKTTAKLAAAEEQLQQIKGG